MLEQLASEARARAAEALERLRGWLTDDPSSARSAAAGFDRELALLRCRIQRLQALSRSLPEGGAPREAIRAELGPLLASYYRHATATYGSVEAAKQRFDRDAPCSSSVGVAPLLALPAAAWYAAGVVAASGAVAYAVSYASEAARDASVAASAVQRAEHMVSCLQAGGSEAACLQAGQASVQRPPTAGEQAEAAGRGLAGVLAGLALLGAVWAWRQS